MFIILISLSLSKFTFICVYFNFLSLFVHFTCTHAIYRLCIYYFWFAVDWWALFVISLLLVIVIFFFSSMCCIYTNLLVQCKRVHYMSFVSILKICFEDKSLIVFYRSYRTVLCVSWSAVYCVRLFWVRCCRSCEDTNTYIHERNTSYTQTHTHTQRVHLCL